MKTETPGSSPEQPHNPEIENNRFNKDKLYLLNILEDKNYEAAFSECYSVRQRSELEERRKLFFKGNPNLDRRALEINQSIIIARHPEAKTMTEAEIKKNFGREFGQQVQISRNQAREDLSFEFEQGGDARRLMLEIRDRRAEASKIIAELKEEFAKHSETERFRIALDAWGRSRNGKNDSGSNNEGYNAGIVHFFEYRGIKDKIGRFFDRYPFTIEEFIKVSGILQDMMEYPQTSQSVNQSALVADGEGARRLIVLSNGGWLTIGFSPAGSRENPKVITFMPGQREQDFFGILSTELAQDPRKDNRFNKLSFGRMKVFEYKASGN